MLLSTGTVRCEQERGLLIIPPLKWGERLLTDEENCQGYKIAAARVHVEYAIERMKKFEVLKYVKICQMEHIDQVLVTTSFICNCQRDLIKD